VSSDPGDFGGEAGKRQPYRSLGELAGHGPAAEAPDVRFAEFPPGTAFPMEVPLDGISRTGS
jgi:hypothetical protein